jgi:multidrug efflux pump subunit AcrA (membrane-fusion protein)
MKRDNHHTASGIRPPVSPAARALRLWLFWAAAFSMVMGSAPRGSAGVPASVPGRSPIQLSPRQRQLIGLRFATVQEKDIQDLIPTTALVEPDEQLEGYVQTHFAGWIREVFVNQTYQYVKRGQTLFTIYSPDLVSAEQEYLLALDLVRGVRTSSVEDVASGADSLLQGALQRLKLFGVAPSEIARLKRERKVRDAIPLDSPTSGYVIDWSALPNKYVQPDTRLYTIANLSNVWVYAAVFQNQLGEVKVGDPVSLTVDTYPGKSLAGHVDFIWQAMDPTTRTARVRCAFPNAAGLLKLGMYASIVIKPQLGRALVIPDGGVLRTGVHDIAFVDQGDGYLLPVEVEPRAHTGHEFVVRKGLRAGDRVVSSANFLIDSESQFQAAVGTFVPPPPGAGGAANTTTATISISTKPSPPRKGDNQVLVALHDSSGRPVSDAHVSLVFFMPAMPAMGMSAMRIQALARPRGNGRYSAQVTLDSGGTWTLTVIANRSGKQIANSRFTISAAGGM